jgi:hypothetical protein
VQWERKRRRKKKKSVECNARPDGVSRHWKVGQWRVRRPLSVCACVCVCVCEPSVYCASIPRRSFPSCNFSAGPVSPLIDVRCVRHSCHNCQLRQFAKGTARKTATDEMRDGSGILFVRNRPDSDGWPDLENRSMRRTRVFVWSGGVCYTTQ